MSADELTAADLRGSAWEGLWSTCLTSPPGSSRPAQGCSHGDGSRIKEQAPSYKHLQAFGHITLATG